MIISIPYLQYGGVLQYNIGKVTSDGLITTVSLKAPREVIAAGRTPRLGLRLENIINTDTKFGTTLKLA